jgi:hypothetical protein
MPFKKRRRRSRASAPRRVSHRRLGRLFHRRRDKRFSIIGTAGAIGSIFAPAPNHMSLGQWLVDFATGKTPTSEIGNKMPYVISDTIAQYTGYSFMDGTWNLPTGTIVLIGSSIAASIAGRFGNKHLKNIPFIGKYVKM